MPLRVGIVGCGVISRAYVETAAAYPQLELVGAADIEADRARALAATFGGIAYPRVEDLLADSDVDIVLNLTVQAAHADVTRRSLDAGKHVYSEKPIALSSADARALVAVAQRSGLRLSASPMTFLGDAQQAAWGLIRDGRLGEVRVAYADMNWGRVESWHPAPLAYYDVGPLYDIGVYALTLFTTFFGPARSAVGYGRVLWERRTAADGSAFTVKAPDFVVALVEFPSGVVARLTTDWYVGHATKQKGLEVHGDLGSLFLGSVQHFDGVVQFAPFGGEFEAVPFARPPFHGTDWARGLAELADAILEDRASRVTAEHAAHVVEILEAITASSERGGPVEVTSTFRAPEPMP